MAKRNGYNYFRFFCEMTDCACRAARALNDLFASYQPDNLRREMETIHEIEHEADLKKHAMMQKLLKEFLPPIDREDIITIAHVMDEVIDLIEEVVLSLYMNDVTVCRPDVLPICGVIVKQCGELCKLMAEFEHYKKSSKIMEHVVTINTLEEESDRLFLEAMRNLSKTSSGPMELIAWKEIYKSLEDCADACEKVADAVEEVVMKNT